MKIISKNDLCSACRQIRPFADSTDVSMRFTIEEFLGDEVYRQPNPFGNGNDMLLAYLRQHGGCPNCIKLAERATQS